ncbi:36005_t:CDS:2 [Gigaspora margarita]|uniref:36005_t:CDS:1 n=1 Tax=Gigaspora margarita TaxID=4874 RepID=A0ABM8W6G0_GIGMA|nr:36005_t:CDS:2 [Gigaspora margarita]
MENVNKRIGKSTNLSKELKRKLSKNSGKEVEELEQFIEPLKNHWDLEVEK